MANEKAGLISDKPGIVANLQGMTQLSIQQLTLIVITPGEENAGDEFGCFLLSMYRRNGTINFQALSVCETQGQPAFSLDYVLPLTSFSKFLGSYISTQVPPDFCISRSYRFIRHTQVESLQLGELCLLKLKSMIARLLFIYQRRQPN